MGEGVVGGQVGSEVVTQLQDVAVLDGESIVEADRRLIVLGRDHGQRAVGVADVGRALPAGKADSARGADDVEACARHRTLVPLVVEGLHIKAHATGDAAQVGDARRREIVADVGGQALEAGDARVDVAWDGVVVDLSVGVAGEA